MSRAKAAGRAALVVLAAVVALAIVTVVAYAIDTRGDDRVARNVTLAGRDVGRLTRAQLEERVGALALDVGATTVTVTAPEGGFETSTQALGVRLLQAETVEAVFGIGRSGTIIDRIVDWVGSLTGEQPAPVQLAADEGAVWEVVAERDPGPRQAPTEPTIRAGDGGFETVAGKPGTGIDPAEVIEALPPAVAEGLPVRVEVDRGGVEPRFDEADAAAAAARAEELTQAPVLVAAGGEDASIPPATVRSWVTTSPTREGLRLDLDDDKVLASLEKALPDAGKRPVETRFTVDGGAVRIIPGQPGSACCAPEAADAIQTAVLGAERERITVPLRARPPRLTVEEARALGVREPIATFTTSHPAGQPRVENIHHIADLLRGTLILPGTTFSVNDTIGRRTKEKGFVAAPVIENGRFSEGVGGGISQFATTLFNAAFFGGLDFGEYQSHSIYISRYPYGREATLSYPHPDLQIENTTPYGVVVWPTYTSTSITVTLYSTKYATGEQTGQTTSQRGNCTRVSTERTRTYTDGRKKVDHVYATYRPAEGVNC